MIELKAKKINEVSRPVVFDKNYIKNAVEIFERIYDKYGENYNGNDFAELLHFNEVSEYNQGDVGYYNQKYLYDVYANTSRKFGSSKKAPYSGSLVDNSYDNRKINEKIDSGDLYKIPCSSVYLDYEFLLNIPADKIANVTVYLMAAFFAKKIPFVMNIPRKEIQHMGYKYPIRLLVYEEDLEYITRVFDKVEEKYHPGTSEENIGFAKYNDFVYYDCLEHEEIWIINRTEYILSVIYISLNEVIRSYHLVDENLIKLGSSLSNQKDRALFLHWVHQCEEKDPEFWNRVYNNACEKLQKIGLDINDLFGKNSVNVKLKNLKNDVKRANSLDELSDDEMKRLRDLYQTEYEKLTSPQNIDDGTQLESVEQEVQPSTHSTFETEYLDNDRVPEKSNQTVQTSTRSTSETEYFDNDRVSKGSNQTVQASTRSTSETEYFDNDRVPEESNQTVQASTRSTSETEYFDINRVSEENSHVVQTSTQPTIRTEYFAIPSNTPSDEPQANDKPEENIETSDFVKYAWITKDPNFFNRTIEVKDKGQMTVYEFLDYINANDLLSRALANKDYQDFKTNPNVNLSGVVLADAKITNTSVVDFFEYVISLAKEGNYDKLLQTPQFLLHREEKLIDQSQLAKACKDFAKISNNPDYYNRRLPYSYSDETVGNYLLKSNFLNIADFDDTVTTTSGETLTGAAFWNYALTLVGRFSLDKIKEDFILDIKSSKNMEPAEAPRKLSLKERFFGRSRK